MRHNLSVKTVFLHMLPLLFVVFVMADDKSVIRTFGGISDVKTSIAASLQEIMTWNLCVISPVLLCYRIFNIEFSTVRFNTIIRSGKIDHWWKKRTILIVFFNIGYSLLIILMDMIVNYDAPHPWLYVNFFIAFTTHILFLSYIAILTLILNSRLQWSIILYLIIEIIFIIFGIELSSWRKYLLPYWGMINNSVYIGGTAICHFLITEVISLIVILMLNKLIMKHILEK